MLPGYQPDPSGETAARREGRPIPDLSDQSSGNDRADTGDLFQPPAFFTRPVPGVDVLLDGSDLGHHGGVLATQNGKAQSRDRWDAIILLIGNHLEQLSRAIAALG